MYHLQIEISNLLSLSPDLTAHPALPEVADARERVAALRLQ